MNVTDYLEGPFLDLVLENGSFKYNNFHEDFRAVLSESLSSDSALSSNSVPTSIADEDMFTVTFLGAFLWLLKYRTLSTNRNSPRKLAFLDMFFDIEMPRLIDLHLSSYDTDKIKEAYDLMDVRCKKEYTGEVPKGEPPPFLVSPIWTKNIQPHPFKVAAKVFSELVVTVDLEKNELSANDWFLEKLAQHFVQMTAPVEKISSPINFTWSTSRQERKSDTSKNESSG